MALVEDFETTIKVIVVGNGGVGKSSMIRRFCTGEFTDTYKKTIGVDFLEKEHYISSIDQSITFMVWDTAGQEEFADMTKQYYRNAHGCVIAFSTTDRDSFDAIETWKGKVEAELGVGTIAMALVQNKVDLIDKAAATAEEVEALAKRLKMKLFRTCVSENLNVDKVFEHIGQEYVNGPAAQDGEQPGVAPITQAGNAKGGAAPAAEKPKEKAAEKPARASSAKAEPAAEDEAPAEPEQGGAADFGAGGGGGGAKKSGGPLPPPSSKKGKDKEGVIQIQGKPKQRTGGKKKFSCSIL